MNNSLMKKWGLLLVTMSLISQIGPAFAEDSLKDIKTHWSKTYVDRLYKEGYVVGSNGYFNPNQALKTEDFLIMVLKTVDPSSKDLKATEGQKYYQPFLERALAVGLIKDPYDEVPQYLERMMPRELAVQVIDRALTMKGENVTADHGLEYKFKDYAIINDVNKEAVLKAYQLGIIKGSNGNFEPKNPLTRAEAAVLVSKLMDKSLRDKLTFSKNTNPYDPYYRFYLDHFDKTAGSRTVVVERKADGAINDGDLDYKEIRKWWSDQEFEDSLITHMYDRKFVKYSSAIIGKSNKEFPELESVQGTFYVHNGELAFTDVMGEYKQMAVKFYDSDVPNANRLVYDLTKYCTQFAKEKGLYSEVSNAISYIKISLSNTPNQVTSRFGILILNDGENEKKAFTTKYTPKVAFFYNGINWKEDEVYIKQAIYRIYGSEKGEKAFQFIKSNLINRDVPSKGFWTKKVDGINYSLADEDFSKPYIISDVY